MIKALKILHSKCTLTGKEVSTFLLEYPLEIHAELLTHRDFGRNAASGRAIPTITVIEQCLNNTVIPLWTKNQSGMSGDRITDISTLNNLNQQVEKLLHKTIKVVNKMVELGAHKQNANRYLNAFTHIRVIVTSEEWDNWFNLRYDEEHAKPEIFELAKAMAAEFHTKPPTPLEPGDWHTPFADPSLPVEDRKKQSASLNAQVSFRKDDPSLEKADVVFSRLVLGNKLHASPFEHVCRILEPGEKPKGNLPSFHQYRTDIENEYYADVPKQEKFAPVNGSVVGSR